VELVIAPTDTHRVLVLVTDGVTDVLGDGEIAELAVGALSRPTEQRLPGLPPHEDDARAAARAVVAAAAANAAAHDNMTCVCAVFAV